MVSWMHAAVTATRGTAMSILMIVAAKLLVRSGHGHQHSKPIQMMILCFLGRSLITWSGLRSFSAVRSSPSKVSPAAPITPLLPPPTPGLSRAVR